MPPRPHGRRLPNETSFHQTGGGSDHKVYFAAYDDLATAHYVCALLNSAAVREFVDGFTVKIQVGTLFRNLTLPGYDASNPAHQRLTALSVRAHRLRAAIPTAPIGTEQRAIDQIAESII